MNQRIEYRVRWQREGLRPRTKLYQALPAAERWALILRGRMQEVTGNDPDAYACCSGYECGCGGVTNEMAWDEQSAKVPRLVLGPVIEARIVGEWSPAPHTTGRRLG